MKLPPKKKQKTRLTNKAIRYLSYRPRSVQEVRSKLEQSSGDAQLIDQIIAELEELNLLNDDNFTDWLIHSRINSSLKGPNYIKRELTKFGISRQTAQKHLSQIDRQDLVKSALKLLEKKYKQPLTDFKATQKAKRYLYSRGYSSQTISAAIDEKAARE